ncbi:MAG: Gfo/Idh/MocA family oxidoreductase [Candidatus Latescibacterota bacterium]
MNRKLRMGMIGGGIGAFIGAAHRMAAALDGECELVCGAFSSSPERSHESGDALYLPRERVYGTFAEMILREKDRPAGDRMDFVSIVTPNHLHFPPAKMALENGFPVVCDKPMTLSLDEAKKLESIVKKTGLLFALTHNYTGYPMVKEARYIIAAGKLGKIRKIVVEYPQGWLATRIEAEGQKQAVWRTDPSRSGIAGCMGDIGTHAENLAEYVTGLAISELCADLTTFVEGRQLDDDGNVLIHFENGARGILYASQISAGEENPLRIRVYGEKGGLEWAQQEPNTLILKWMNRPMEIYRTSSSYLSDRSKFNTRLPAGHPEGFIEAFANIYRNFILTLKSSLDGVKPKPEYLDFPTVKDGVRGMAFIETVVEASRSDSKWMKFKE